MRGVTFSPTTCTENGHTQLCDIPNGAQQQAPASMMKKLSTTFRRKASVCTRVGSTSPPRSPKGVLKAGNVLSGDSGRYKKSAGIPSGRAMTFSVPSRNGTNGVTTSTTEIPFFGDRLPPSRGPVAKVAMVRGAPCKNNAVLTDRRIPSALSSGDPTSSDTASDGHVSPPTSTSSKARHPPSVTDMNRNVSPPILRDANRGLDSNRSRGRSSSRYRHLSFDADTCRKMEENINQGRVVRQHLNECVSEEENEGKVRKRRWFLPGTEAADKPRVFTPRDNGFRRITRHRDRAEGRTLVSACTFLEGEIDRMSAHVRTHTEFLPGRNVSTIRCANGPPSHHACHNDTISNDRGSEGMMMLHHCCADCAKNCPLVGYLPAAIDRLKVILSMLEDRYDSIEEVYVKSEEYAEAMGKFFNVSRDQFAKMIEEKESSTRRDGSMNIGEKRKSFR